MTKANPEHSLPLPPMAWNAWGDPEKAKPLPDGVVGLLSQALGISGLVEETVAPGDVAVPPTRLSDAQQSALAAVVGDDFVATGPGDRLWRAGGKSTIDLLRRRESTQDAPDAVVMPSTDEQVLALLQWAQDEKVAVVPFGGGTSVVGGLDPNDGGHGAVIAVDLARFDAMHSLDTTSGIASFGAGVTGPRAEELLGAQGFSLGHFPQSFQYATLGGYAATRSSGQASAGYGRFDDMVTELTVVTPAGILRCGGRAPKSAAGPDLRQLFLGSEGTLGLITEVSVRVHKASATVRREAWQFPDFASGATALRLVAQSGVLPTVMRLSDEAETGINLAMTEKIGENSATGGALAITTFDGEDAETQARQELTRQVFSQYGTSLGSESADAWDHGRFSAPYLRDSLIGVGVGCETLETVTTWANLDALKAAVTDAINAKLAELGPAGLVLCHISHTYPTGASLYFTVVYKLADDPIDQWTAVKAAASQAISDNGGSITHHHAVGADHRPWLGAEVGDLGVRVLRAVKAELDPHAILNPGKLIP